MVDSISCDTLLLLAFARLYTLLVYYVSTHKVHLCEFVVQSLRTFLFSVLSVRHLTTHTLRFPWSTGLTLSVT